MSLSSQVCLQLLGLDLLQFMCLWDASACMPDAPEHQVTSGITAADQATPTWLSMDAPLGITKLVMACVIDGS